ncbi:hypothetical protein NPX13_g11141 [Xylaria arbuscula]|uniref:Uncharacterized protein n=1 Tax=Xylaria arbuscula TaxID=114810 RepID=A0A9W8N383_9PEZI|nr:hypothetical protein NPX13_g11141 [Xylaria arbuscula]
MSAHHPPVCMTTASTVRCDAVAQQLEMGTAALGYISTHKRQIDPMVATFCRISSAVNLPGERAGRNGLSRARQKVTDVWNGGADQGHYKKWYVEAPLDYARDAN